MNKKNTKSTLYVGPYRILTTRIASSGFSLSASVSSITLGFGTILLIGCGMSKSSLPTKSNRTLMHGRAEHAAGIVAKSPPQHLVAKKAAKTAKKKPGK
jgi:hypothetical protein